MRHTALGLWPPPPWQGALRWFVERSTILLWRHQLFRALDCGQVLYVCPNVERRLASKDANCRPTSQEEYTVGFVGKLATIFRVDDFWQERAGHLGEWIS